MRVDDDRIALPLRACQDYVGSVIDDAGGEVLVVDVNGDLPDHVVQARTVMLVRAVNSGARRAADSSAANASYQGAVAEWMLACFGEAIARDRMERNHRFLEESLELDLSGLSPEELTRLRTVVERAIDQVCTVGRTLKNGTEVTFEVKDVGGE